ncbi:MAG: hypothetical protein IJM60_08275 [Bacteroidales bacterium]|nr:hypothetical protein [Bacteroidales bacterium]
MVAAQAKRISIRILIIVLGVLVLYQIGIVFLFSRIFKQDPRQLALLEINGIQYELWYTPEGAYNRAMLKTMVNGHEYHFCQYSLPSPPGDSLVSVSDVYIKDDTLHFLVNLIEQSVLFKLPVLDRRQEVQHPTP